MTDNNKKNKPPLWKRRYLVQKAYQLRYSFLIASIGSLALLFAVYVIKYSVESGLLPISIPQINILRVASFIFITWFLLGIIYTHTTAGPVTQLINAINKISEGKLEGIKINFRRGDDLQDLPEYFNNMVKVLQFRSNEEKILLKDLHSHFSQLMANSTTEKNEIGKNLEYAIQKLNKLITKKERYLGPRNLNSANTEGGRIG